MPGASFEGGSLAADWRPPALSTPCAAGGPHAYLVTFALLVAPPTPPLCPCFLFALSSLPSPTDGAQIQGPKGACRAYAHGNEALKIGRARSPKALSALLASPPSSSGPTRRPLFSTSHCLVLTLLFFILRFLFRVPAHLPAILLLVPSPRRPSLTTLILPDTP
ncbi:hypothetical protein C8R44DRAFT_981387 [Mycena epipterygia]|nr:hypothetical protein C8R44DRAFT_981387 [Mycena epipterygia]